MSHHRGEWIRRVIGFSERHPWFTNPFLWSLASTFFTLVPSVGLARYMILEARHISLLQNYLLGVSLTLGPALALAATVVFYPSNEKILRRVIYSFLAVLVTYSNIYFALDFLKPFDAPSPFNGMHQVLSPLDNGSWNMVESDILHSYIDSLHYSVQTITTAGLSSIYATTWWAKLLTDSEVLLGLGITVIGIGRHFAGRKDPR